MQKITVGMELACEMLSMSRPTVMKFMAAGMLKYSKVGRDYIFRVEAIDEFAKSIEGYELDLNYLENKRQLTLVKKNA